MALRARGEKRARAGARVWVLSHAPWGEAYLVSREPRAICHPRRHGARSDSGWQGKVGEGGRGG